MTEFPFHPLANLFPLIEGPEFDELVADIKANGLREAIWLYEGQILDGRNRARACRKARVDPDYIVYNGKDPAALVVSLNLKRRHLDTSQRAMIAAKLANLKHGQKRADSANALTQADAAKMLNVSVDSVKRAKVVLDRGDDELTAAVEAGEKAVSAAVRIVLENQPAPPVPQPTSRKAYLMRRAMNGKLTDAEHTEFDQVIGFHYAFRDALKAIATMPVTPKEYVETIEWYRVKEMEKNLDVAVDWLTEFAAQWRRHKNVKTIDLRPNGNHETVGQG